MHHTSQSARRTPHMRLKMETAEKLADGVGSNPALEAKYKESGHDQTEEPGAAFLRFPQPLFRVAVAAIDGLEVTMHAAFGQAHLVGKTSDAQLPGFTNNVENAKTVGPQSHVVGPYAEEWLKS